MEIEEHSLDDFFDKNIQPLITEYSKLSLNTPEQSVTDYTSLTKENLRQVYKQTYKEADISFILATDDNNPVGFSIIEYSMQTHLNFKTANINSLFISKDYRKLGNGKQLLNKTFEVAKQHGAKGFYLIAPVGSRLESVFNRLFVKTDSLFFKEL